VWGLRQAASLYRAQEVIRPSEIFPLFRLFETGKGNFPSLHSGKGKGERWLCMAISFQWHGRQQLARFTLKHPLRGVGDKP
jgi:hypothetical protein